MMYFALTSLPMAFLLLSLLMKYYATTEFKATEQYFSVVLFVML